MAQVESSMPRPNVVILALGAGLVGGGFCGLVDLAQMAGSDVTLLSRVLLFCLDILGATTLALIGAGAAWFNGYVARRLQRSWWAGVLDGFWLMLALLPVLAKMFDGPAISRSVWGIIGPFLGAVLVWLAGAVGSTAARTARRGPRRWLLAALALGLALGVGVTEKLVLVGLYGYLHLAAALVAMGLVTLAAALLMPARLPTRLVAPVSAGFAITAIVATLVLPRDNNDRILLGRGTALVTRLASTLRWAVDLDRDGWSPLLGGGDCDDLTASVAPGRREVDGNGVDEDCDGLDYLPKVPVRLSYARFDAARARRLSREAARRPTVVLVIDALRSDHVPGPGLPHLSRLVRSSLWFPNAFAPASSTARSLPAVITGRPMPGPQVPSLFERLKPTGTRSALVCLDNVLLILNGTRPTAGTIDYPFERGFSRIVTVHSGENRRLRAWEFNSQKARDTKITDRALALLRQPRPPEILWAHYFDMHQWERLHGLRSTGYSRYREVLQRLDREIGRWLALGDRVNLVLTADHGEALGEKGMAKHTQYLYKPLVHVPVLIRIPGVPPARIGRSVALTDLAPTLFDLRGQIGLAPEWRQRSLLGVAGAAPGGDRMIPAFEVGHHGLTTGTWRLIRDLSTGAVSLFSLHDDPLERHNLVEVAPQRAKTMQRQLRALWRMYQP